MAQIDIQDLRDGETGYTAQVYASYEYPHSACIVKTAVFTTPKEAGEEKLRVRRNPSTHQLEVRLGFGQTVRQLPNSDYDELMQPVILVLPNGVRISDHILPRWRQFIWWS